MNLDARFTDLDEMLEPHIICWKRLDARETEVELATLADWVAWFFARYLLDHKVVPPCWSQHGNLIEELAALRSLWEGCFEDDASTSDPITFHRELDLSIRRLREWGSRLGCSRTNHRPERAVGLEYAQHATANGQPQP